MTELVISVFFSAYLLGVFVGISTRLGTKGRG